MKRIAVISTVKNESDIIESFCRQTATFCDVHFILNNGSTDNTLEIINELYKEGLNINIVSAIETKPFDYIVPVLKDFINTAIDSYGADIVIPLDGDELLFAHPNTEFSIRDVLESLPEVGLYAYSARTRCYIPTVFKRKNDEFMPKYFNKYHESVMNTSPFQKVFMNSRIIKEHGAIFNLGNHNAFIDNRKIERMYVPELMLTHFPIRSVEQLMTKVIIMWMDNLRVPNRKNDSLTGYHTRYLYEQIKEKGFLTEAQAQAFAVYAYTEKYCNPDMRIQLLDYVWDSDIVLKYTNYENTKQNYMNSILTNFENIIDDYLKE